MNYQSRGLQISFAIHALFILMVAGISSTVTAPAKIIKIDFSLGEPCPALPKKPQLSSPVATPKKAAPPNGPLSPSMHTQPSAAIAETTPENSSAIPGEKPAPIPEAIDREGAQPPLTASSESPISAPTPMAPRSSTSTPETAGAQRDDTTSKSPAIVTATGNQAAPQEAAAAYLKSHFSYIRDLIQKSIIYPKLARAKGWEGNVLVSFMVCENGLVENITIKESSGFALLDQNVTNTIKKLAPFPIPPVKAELIMPIAYRLN